MEKYSYLKSQNAAYIDEMFEKFRENPDSVEGSWRGFFEGVEFGESSQPQTGGGDFNAAEAEVAELIAAYRESGLMLAKLDPLSPTPPAMPPRLELSNFGLTEADLDKTFTASRMLGLEPCTLREIIARLREIYCSSIGVEFTHIQDPISRNWLCDVMESTRNKETLAPEDRKFVLKRLTESETWETFLNTRYVAKKRFSLEGSEALIPALDRLIEVGAELGAKHFVMGMAHRGRLNVLTNIYGKKPEFILSEFEEAYFVTHADGLGDVKYHMGFSADLTTRQNKSVHLSLAHNPSHLEFINPVVEGMARAKQRSYGDKDRGMVIPILIHGDAAFAGQGVVYETLNLSQVPGYKTGGTVHIVINNQVGFTTDTKSGRSTTYCTDMAKMLEVPIFHVNGDDPEAVLFVAKLSMLYRQQFRRDVVIDMISYRKYGHNEGDEPAFTQPLMYKTIRAHTPVRALYAKKLQELGIVTATEAQALVDASIERLTQAQQLMRAKKPKPYFTAYTDKWAGLSPSQASEVSAILETRVAKGKLIELGKRLAELPEGFTAHPKLQKFYEARVKTLEEGVGIDWGNAEALAYASLLAEGHPIRLTGQDTERGTFSHRHAILHDYNTGGIFNPFNNLGEGQADFNIRNSILSETAVLGFEYGWSLADPNALVIWEAQFGDFANGAQVIIDQFLSSSEIKWQRSSGIVLYLPHGYEGQGPEHSSARLERFLQLSGENNFSVCNFSTPGNLFHALRRQVKRKFRKPMIIMTPKKLLRAPISTIQELSDGNFLPVIDDPSIENPKSIERVILCSGKIYYELAEERLKLGLKNVALVRVEELYPWPETALAKVLQDLFANAKDLVWVQEEPRNQGAWTYVFNQWAGGYGEFSKLVGNRSIRYIGRKISAAPTSGSEKAHQKIQSEIVKTALQGDK